MAGNNQKNKKKTICLKLLIAVLVVLVLVSGCVLAFKSMETPLQIYSEKPCPDAVYFGTSATYRYWMAPEAYLQQGITVYTYSAGAFSGFAYKYFIGDVLKHQNPEMIIIEVRPFAQPDKRRTDHVQIALDYMPFSVQKYMLLFEYLSYGHKYDMPIADNPKNYLPVQLRTDKTLEIVQGHIVKHSMYKGFLISSETDNCTSYDRRPFIDGTASLPYDGEEDFTELLDYCDKLDCEVLFVASPVVGNLEKQKYLNRLTNMAENRGYDCINFNNDRDYDAMGLDSQTDFYNSRHVNIKGALKYTTYFAEILKKDYKLEDHRGDPSYDSWQESGEKLRTEYKKLTESMR